MMKPPKRLFRTAEDVAPRTPVGGTSASRPGQALPQNSTPDLSPHIDVTKHVICCPNQGHVELETRHALGAMETLGFRVDLMRGASAIDVCRSWAASDYLMQGFESMLFVDSDIMFNPEDALSLLLSDEPLICGAYAAKKLGQGQLNLVPESSVATISFGPETGGIYPVRCCGAGLMRIKMSALTLIRDALQLPWVRVMNHYGWPFFLPVIVEEDGEDRYLSEDYAFCWRARQVGIQPKIDTRFRVYHQGIYSYGLEEAAGHYVPRNKEIEFTWKNPEPAAAT